MYHIMLANSACECQTIVVWNHVRRRYFLMYKVIALPPHIYTIHISMRAFSVMNPPPTVKHLICLTSGGRLNRISSMAQMEYVPELK